jgi:general secretion pathway protein K
MKKTVHSSQFTVHNQKGSALLITLLIVALLTSLAVEFAYEVYVDTAALSNWGNAQKASLIAKSGQNLSSKYVSAESKRPYTYPGEIALPVGKDFGPDTLLTIKIEDENSKFNINSIIYPNGLTNEEALLSLKKLFEYLNINPSLALSIADWIDPDQEPRLSSIPSGMGLRDSEDRAKNSYLWSVDELNLIEGIDEKTLEIIRPFITVYSNGLVNINTAKLPVLVSLRDDITEILAKRIIDYRENTPFEDATHIQRVSGMETIGPLLLGRITTKSSNFRVISTVTVNKITRVIESVMDTSMKIQYWREG